MREWDDEGLEGMWGKKKEQRVVCPARPPQGGWGEGLSPATHERSSVEAPGGHAVRKGWGARVSLQEGVPRPRLPSLVGGRMVGPGQGCGDKRPFLGRVPEVWLPGPTLRIYNTKRERETAVSGSTAVGGGSVHSAHTALPQDGGLEL